MVILKNILHGLTESTSVAYIHITEQPPLFSAHCPPPPFFYTVRQFIQVRAENSRSSPHTYVLGLNSLEDYVVQAFVLFIQNGTSKRCYERKTTQLHRMLKEGEWVVIFIKQEHYFQAIQCHFYVQNTTGTVEHTTY